MKDHSKLCVDFIVQFFLPGYLYTPIRFLKEILSGDKVVSSEITWRLWRLRMCRNATSLSTTSSRSTLFTRKLWTSSQRWRITSLTIQTSTCLQGNSSGVSSVLSTLTLWERLSSAHKKREWALKRTRRKNWFVWEMTFSNSLNEQHTSQVSSLWLLERKNGWAIHLLKTKAKLEFKKKRSMRDFQNMQGGNPFDEVMNELEDFAEEEFKGNRSKRVKLSSGGKQMNSEAKMRKKGDFEMNSQDMRMNAGSGEKPFFNKQAAFA